MTTYAAGARKPEFTVGETLQSALSATGANFWVLLGAALVLVGVPRFLLLLSGVGGTVQVHAGGPPVKPFFILLTFVGGVTNLLLQASVVRASVSFLNGQRPTLGECLEAALRLALPLIGIAILSTLGVGLGLLLLLVPGVFLLTAWSVVIPVEVTERKGVFASFSRSFELTRGHRWAVLGVVLVLGILVGIIGLIGGLVTGSLNVILLAGDAVSAPARVIGFLASAVAASVGAIFNSAGIAAVYAELRRVKEGATPQTLAAVFD